MNAEEVKKRMNECGARGVPYLFAVDFEMTEGIFIEHPLAQQEVLFRTPLAANHDASPAPSGHPSLDAFPISEGEYRRRFDVVMEGLRRGDSFLTNLTVRTPVTTPSSLRDIFFATRSPYGLYVPGKFACFSPERFVHIANRTISTNPMKGTIDASMPNAEAVLMADAKEIAEHYTIVDLMRNDTGMVADDVRVERFRYIDRIATARGAILQTSSEITGRLRDDYTAHLGDIIFRMLPAGSVSGAPKQSTLRIIRHAEQEPRGFYCGVFGVFDGSQLDSGVLIRLVEERGEDKYFRSGGGITINSSPEAEYREVIDKIRLPL